MLELPHTLVGAAIATTLPNPWLALPLTLASHFVTDFVPHWNPHIHTEKRNGGISRRSYAIMGADATAAFLIGSYIAFTRAASFSHTLVILAACLVAVIPDVLEIPYYLFDIRHPWITRLIDFQRSHQWNVKPIYGLLIQLLVVAGSLGVILG